MAQSNHTRLCWASLSLMFWIAFLPGLLRAEAAQVLPEQEHAQWQAIGRVNQAGFNTVRICTGTLIAPEWILTAAHCLQSDLPDPFIFVAGWLRGEYAAYRKIVEVVHDPAFRIVKPLTADVIGRDVALARLASPIETVEPLQAHVAQTLPDNVDLISYSGDVSHMLSAQFDCDVNRLTTRAVTIGCFSLPGNSGGPLLRKTSEGWDVIGVVSAGRMGQAVAKGALLPPNLLDRLAE